ncbi:preprotein translocase subunit YajC [Frankia sp. AgB32]|uniref:preprotein translocase subunit YajC n=1 Tax=Frankia sp. AgB32 TaxID=631119 RepID=UPI00200E35A6|nr:preprotein translocase subunit YajC [Frankia sp. AgB32]MCK9895499.1 preprotein translocase subunit YajC [Frankia sp. AgB32]
MHGLVTAATAAGNGGGSSIGGFLLPLIIVLAVVYIFTMQRRRARTQQDQVSRLVPGALVVTTAGLYATVVELDDGDVLLEVAPDVVCRFASNAVVRVVTPPTVSDDEDTPDGDDDRPESAGDADGPAAAADPTGSDGEAAGQEPDAPRPPRKEL